MHLPIIVDETIAQPALPIIDLSNFDRDVASRRAIAQQIDSASQHSGFFYLRGHGLSQVQLDALFEQCRAFFDLPLEQKQASAWTTAHSNRGYGQLGREKLNPDRATDYKETYNLGYEWDEPDAPKNAYPEALPQFRETVLTGFSAFSAVANRVFRGLAIALDLPEDFFVQRHDQQPFTLRFLHYPPLPNVLDVNQIRAGEHTDYGTITLLAQDNSGGLEVQTHSGAWIAAPPIPGTLLVNLGDLMEHWTNHRYRSTVHRVCFPPGASAGRSRHTVVFFCDANPNTEIACLPSCQDAQNPPLYPPILAGEYLVSRLNRTYQY